VETHSDDVVDFLQQWPVLSLVESRRLACLRGQDVSFDQCSGVISLIPVLKTDMEDPAFVFWIFWLGGRSSGDLAQKPVVLFLEELHHPASHECSPVEIGVK